MNSLLRKIPHLGLYKFSFLVLLGTVLFRFILPQYVYHQVWIILLFFFVLTLVSLFIIQKLTENKSSNFLAIYFSVMIGRLFISIIFATVFILTDRTHVFNFSINFLILYLLFLGFEITGIITTLRLHFKKGTKDE